MNKLKLKKTVLIWIIVIIAGLLFGYYVLPGLTGKAHGVINDDLTREQQVILMRECLMDAFLVEGNIRDWLRKNPSYPSPEISPLAAAFFEYRMRER